MHEIKFLCVPSHVAFCNPKRLSVLLGIAATRASRGLSHWAIMVFPILFSAGMSLIDTLDGHMMLGAYGWAYLKPIRKIYYNMTITLVSVIVAVVIGGIEALGLLADQLKLQGPVWDAIGTLNDNFGTLATSSLASLPLAGLGLS